MAKHVHRAMDTEFSVTFGPRHAGEEDLCAAAAAACFGLVDSLENTLTRFSDCSDVAVIGALRDGAGAVVAPATMELLVECARVCAATGGAFDPTLESRSFAQLTLDVENVRVGVARGPVRLDFGGIGKGYALDACGELLRSEQFGLEDWLLDAGTSTQLASGGPWRIGVGGEFSAKSRAECVLEVSSGAVSGSGFELRGGHVRDVRKGGPAARWRNAWSRAPKAAWADALSTAAMSMGPRELEAACAELGARVLAARPAGGVFSGFRDPLKWFGGADACGSAEG